MLEFFSTTGFKQHLKKAKAILDGNWTGSYTKPSPGLYPHQWNWDSAFVAMGYAHYRPRRAKKELAHLFAHQWDNGMVPQIVFNPEALGNYFPEPDFWRAPGGRLTSGITMPPLHATACLAVHRRDPDPDFLKAMWPKLLASHRYFYRERDPEGSGLVYIRHPWESGLDNSPSWDRPLMAIELDRAKLPAYRRRDLDHGVPADQRPSDDYYDRYVFLVDLFRRHGYDEAAIYRDCPFVIQDVLFNSILCRAGRDLVEIGRIIGQDTARAAQWSETTALGIREKMWSPERGQFDPYCLKSRSRLPAATAAGFMPLFAAAADTDQAETLYQRINSVSFCALHQGNCFTVPNFDMDHEQFDSRNYWRGPVWININWMLSAGLKNYGYQEKADSIRKDLIQLPVRFGFHEYFDSRTGAGYGSDNFSWTAALFIDLVQEYYDRDQSCLVWCLGEHQRSLVAPERLNPAPQESDKPAESDLAAKLMVAIGELKSAFYDLKRGLVDYRAMKGSARYLDYLRLAGRLARFDLDRLTGLDERLAFWINLYNTIVVQGIVELGLDSSVRQVQNFFSRIYYDIGGEGFSPDDMEHGILRGNARPPYHLRPVFGRNDPRRRHSIHTPDPRVHFALVCGSRSCAPISFYSADQIHQQLESATRNFVNSSEVVILPEANKIMLSQIFNWYPRDFGSRTDMFEFLLEYLSPDEKAEHLRRRQNDITIEYLFYDWNLNH